MKATKFAMAAALVMAAFSATAAPEPLKLTTGGTNSSKTFGNVRTFTEAITGVTVTATAWSLTGKKDTFENASLEQYSTGLGVCNREEGEEYYDRKANEKRIKDCGNPEHQVSNNEGGDFVLFQFSEAVDPTLVKINPYGNLDSDVSYWTGMIEMLSLAGKSLDQLTGLGFNTKTTDLGPKSDAARDVAIKNDGLVNSLLFGTASAPVEEKKSDKDKSKSVKNPDTLDYFKIASISFDYTKPTPPVEVPEPGSLALIALALGGLGLARRRRAA